MIKLSSTRHATLHKRHNKIHYIITQKNMAQKNTQHNATLHNTKQRSTTNVFNIILQKTTPVQHNITKHNTVTQHSTTRQNITKFNMHADTLQANKRQHSINYITYKLILF